MTFDEDDIASTILELTSQRGPSKTICPSEVARALAGSDEKLWRLLMKPVRAKAIALAKSGQVVIKRKGKAVDPDDFRGVYRLGQPDKEDG